MPALVYVSDNSFDAEVLKCDIPVLAAFLTTWSAPSQTLAEQLIQLAADYQDRLKFVGLDIEANPTVTSQYHVFNVPTLILFKFGQEVARLSGMISTTELLDQVTPFLDE